MRTFLPAMCPAFFIRVRPASRNAKPACMNITSTAVTTTQIVLAAISRSLLETAALSTDLHLPEAPPCAVVRDVLDRGRPDEAVAGFVAAPCRVDDRVDRSRRVLVRDDERQERLRQEARLEDAPPVLVRDAALLAVADGLDHGDPHVPRGLLDRVDHRLDPLADHDRLHLHHPRSSLNDKSPRTRRSPEAPMPRDRATVGAVTRTR